MTFDDEETTFAEDFTKNTEIFLEFLRKHFSKMQKRVPTFARPKRTVSNAVRTVVTSPLFAKTRKSRNFHFFDFRRQIHVNAIVFRFSGPKSDFSRPGSRMWLYLTVSWYFFRSPGAEMRLLRPKVTFSHFSDFCAQKSPFPEK